MTQQRRSVRVVCALVAATVACTSADSGDAPTRAGVVATPGQSTSSTQPSSKPQSSTQVPSTQPSGSPAPKAIKGFNKPLEEPWVDHWRLVSFEQKAALPSAHVCGAVAHGGGSLSGPTQTLANGSAVVRIVALTDLTQPFATMKWIYSSCAGGNPDLNRTHNPTWTSYDDNGRRFRSTFTILGVAPAETTNVTLFVVTALDEGSKSVRDNVDLSGMANNLWGYPGGASLGPQPATDPSAPEIPSTTPSATPVDAALLRALTAARRARPNAARAAPAVTAKDVLVVGRAWNKTIAVVRRPAGSTAQSAGEDGKTAEIWMAAASTPPCCGQQPPRTTGKFVLVHDLVTYDAACQIDDSVCRRVATNGTGLAAVLRHPTGRMVLLLRVPAGMSLRVRNREGMQYTLAEAANGRVLGLGFDTAYPADLHITVVTAQNQEYVLPIPAGGVIAVPG